MAEALGIRQDDVSRLERRREVRASAGVSMASSVVDPSDSAWRLTNEVPADSLTDNGP